MMHDYELLIRHVGRVAFFDGYGPCRVCGAKPPRSMVLSGSEQCPGSVPPGEAHFIQDGKVVAKIINLGS